MRLYCWSCKKWSEYCYGRWDNCYNCGSILSDDEGPNFEEGEDDVPSKSSTGKKKTTGAAGGGNKAVKEINDSNEKSTLGDLDALSALKSEMEK